MVRVVKPCPDYAVELARSDLCETALGRAHVLPKTLGPRFLCWGALPPRGCGLSPLLLPLRPFPPLPSALLLLCVCCCGVVVGAFALLCPRSENESTGDAWKLIGLRVQLFVGICTTSVRLSAILAMLSCLAFTIPLQCREAWT